MDVTHLNFVSAPNSARHSYVGKEGFATVAIEAVCDHKLRCLGVSKAFPGAMNDRTIVMFDGYVKRIKTECKDVAFTLLDKDGAEFEERGLYLIVDGGYQKVIKEKVLCVRLFYSSSMHGVVSLGDHLFMELMHVLSGVPILFCWDSLPRHISPTRMRTCSHSAVIGREGKQSL